MSKHIEDIIDEHLGTPCLMVGGGPADGTKHVILGGVEVFSVLGKGSATFRVSSAPVPAREPSLRRGLYRRRPGTHTFDWKGWQ